MAVRAVRGAVQLERDEAGHMHERVAELLTAILERNRIAVDDLISVWFTATPDLHSDFPAAAARALGITDVPLICAQELDIAGAMPRVVRILAHVESGLSKAEISHVYLGAAARPPQGHRPVRTALVIGTGLIGTSAALALAARGVAVYLEDHDPARPVPPPRSARAPPSRPAGRVDLAIVAVPPAHVAGPSPTPSAAGWPAATSTSPASRPDRAASWRRSAAT